MPSTKRIVVVGAGFVGLATAVFLAKKGRPVHVVEKNPQIVENLPKGSLHFHEPTLRKHLETTVKSGQLTIGLPEAAPFQDNALIFIAIDSVVQDLWKMRLSSFEQMAQWLGQRKTRHKRTVILKSTNILGFADAFRELLWKQPHGKTLSLAVNPEFLREGFAYEDTESPWRVVIGAEKPAERRALVDLYREVYPKNVPIVKTTCKEAELIKLGSNVYLSHRLAFIHELADYARQAGLDIDRVRQGIGLDERVGQGYFNPGLGFGGSCLPKDCNLINSRELDNTFEFKTAQTALEINQRLLDGLVSRLEHAVGQLQDKKIALLGAAFKADLDDTRGSQAVNLALKLAEKGAQVVVFDPFIDGAYLPGAEAIPLADTVDEACHDASAVVIGTAHSRFRRLSAKTLSGLVRNKVIVDYFRILNQPRWQKAGFTFA
ncbi:nucleotide sugar dehydrogenase [candidate division GN15 bacterium]|nr:nucleotide sugar dehydrogenase [candidate division GN15 bacterium]